MVLSDRSIKNKIKTGEISIEPFDEAFLQPASYDLTLGNKFLQFKKLNVSAIDPKQSVKELMEEVVIGTGDYFVLHSKEFILGNVREITGVDASHIGRLEGKSSLARLGIIVHTTAGFLDPGNKLRMTLEIVNLSPLPIKLYPEMKIAQMAFEVLDSPCEKPYGHEKLNSKYLGDTEVEASKMHKNFTH